MIWRNIGSLDQVNLSQHLRLRKMGYTLTFTFLQLIVGICGIVIVQKGQQNLFQEISAIPAIKLGEPDSVRKVRPFVDSLGRERYFHGVNAVVKGYPWHPSIEGFDVDTSLTDDDFKIMQGMGFTVIRLGFMWAGFEPTRGNFNTTYLNVIKSIAANASKFGIYTLIDMHQDVFSERFCGEGMPSWAVQSFGSLRFPEPVDAAFPAGDDRSPESMNYLCAYYLMNYPRRFAAALHPRTAPATAGQATTSPKPPPLPFRSPAPAFLVRMRVPPCSTA